MTSKLGQITHSHYFDTQWKPIAANSENDDSLLTAFHSALKVAYPQPGHWVSTETSRQCCMQLAGMLYCVHLRRNRTPTGKDHATLLRIERVDSIAAVGGVTPITIAAP